MNDIDRTCPVPGCTNKRQKKGNRASGIKLRGHCNAHRRLNRESLAKENGIISVDSGKSWHIMPPELISTSQLCMMLARDYRIARSALFASHFSSVKKNGEEFNVYIAPKIRI